MKFSIKDNVLRLNFRLLLNQNLTITTSEDVNGENWLHIIMLTVMGFLYKTDNSSKSRHHGIGLVHSSFNESVRRMQT